MNSALTGIPVFIDYHTALADAGLLWSIDSHTPTGEVELAFIDTTGCSGLVRFWFRFSAVSATTPPAQILTKLERISDAAVQVGGTAINAVNFHERYNSGKAPPVIVHKSWSSITNEGTPLFRHRWQVGPSNETIGERTDSSWIFTPGKWKIVTDVAPGTEKILTEINFTEIK